MKTSDFDYALPPDRIAAFPTATREGSRLLRLGRYDGTTQHLHFAQVAEHLPARCVIVLNDTRVIPARLRGRKPNGGITELLLVRKVESGEGGGAAGIGERWEALGRNLTRVAPGAQLTFEGGLVAELLEKGDAGAVTVSLRPPPGESVMAVLERVGELPLPPYIEAARRRYGAGAESNGSPRDPAVGSSSTDGARNGDPRGFDRERYQTVYAARPGAVAAPTAGLHFTNDLIDRLRAKGHEIVHLTLHVGSGTFRPVKADDVDGHEMDIEEYTIPAQTADAVNAARRAGRPVLAVGTTVVRALESAAREAALPPGAVRAGPGASRLFLRPGDTFQVVTDLITNFHLPRSTLLMLVAAFAGREQVLAAYAQAVAAGYRFYSYGDAMLIRGTP